MELRMTHSICIKGNIEFVLSEPGSSARIAQDKGRVTTRKEENNRRWMVRGEDIVTGPMNADSD